MTLSTLLILAVCKTQFDHGPYNGVANRGVFVAQW